MGRHCANPVSLVMRDNLNVYDKWLTRAQLIRQCASDLSESLVIYTGFIAIH